MAKTKEIEKTPWKGLLVAVVMLIAGIVIVFSTLFLYTGWMLDPAFIGRILAIFGVLILGGYGISMLNINRFVFVIVIVLAVGADIVIDRTAIFLRQQKLEQCLNQDSAIVSAKIVKVNASSFRKGNPRKFPYIICVYQVGGKDYKQLFQIQKDDPFKEGDIVSLKYYPANPRICIMVNTDSDSLIKERGAR